MSLKITEITSYQTLDIRHRVMWPTKPITFVKLKDDPVGIHFGLWQGSQLISVVSLFVLGKTAQFRKLATEITQQGKGYGTLLINHLIKYSTHLKIEKLWCNARADKMEFYAKFGFQKTATSFVKEGVQFIIMEKTLAA